MFGDWGEMILCDKENQAGPQGTGSHYKSQLVKETGRDLPQDRG